MSKTTATTYRVAGALFFIVGLGMGANGNPAGWLLFALGAGLLALARGRTADRSSTASRETRSEGPDAQGRMT